MAAMIKAAGFRFIWSLMCNISLVPFLYVIIVKYPEPGVLLLLLLLCFVLFFEGGGVGREWRCKKKSVMTHRRSNESMSAPLNYQRSVSFCQNV